jgi:hypothetical protein
VPDRYADVQGKDEENGAEAQGDSAADAVARSATRQPLQEVDHAALTELTENLTQMPRLKWSRPLLVPRSSSRLP